MTCARAERCRLHSEDMGKASKKKKHLRFDPLARPSSMHVDGEADEAPDVKPLSAHQQRHLERKRLQAEAASLKRQRGKVSKADKLVWKAEKKAITKQLHASKAQATALKMGKAAPVVTPAQPAVDVPFAGFDLPKPTRMDDGPALGNWS